MALPKRFRIGVDVGGTNTDGVILDPTRADEEGKGILAWHKAPTTTNPSEGISAAITAMFERSSVAPEEVASVTIGTTHFVNAVVERDASRLSAVAVLRLCGPYSKHSPPCIDWPDDMRALILKHYALLPGGLEVDGSLIGDIDEAAIRAECAVIRAKSIRSVVVCGIFSPIDTMERQEERAAAIIEAELPGCDVVLSKEVANLGFVERENAAILNAAILAFARRTIRSFHEPVQRLGLRCPVFITQNDGTILSGAMAARLPIRTFSSGPTNSMRGAAFLVGSSGLDEALMVVDIGGTTTDVGLLMPTGFPRQQAAYSELAGVRMNFSCPDIKSIGLGGGSIVRRVEGSGGGGITVGPDSVGYKLTEEAIVFGGSVLTTTDCTVMADPSHVTIGEPERVLGQLTAAELAACQAIVRQKIEKVIDTMKTSPEDVPVLLVGGGAVIAPDELQGASRVLKPKWSSVANAIGAAIARVSAVVDTVKSTEGVTTAALLEEIAAQAVSRAIEAGAAADTVKIVEMETLPLQYIANKSRFIVRAAGDFDYSRAEVEVMEADGEDESNGLNEMDQYEKTADKTAKSDKAAAAPDFNIDTYRPTVHRRQWLVNEIDLGWISTGCYILGTGGGGSPYPHMIRLREMLRQGAVVRVVSPDDLADDAQVGTGGGMGSPTVGVEKLPGDEMQEAQYELFKICDRPATHMIALEIGGGNGLQGMILGASSMMDMPVVDGDWMGRAYPTKWQTTPVVFNERSPVWCPIAMSDGKGNVLLMPRATSDLQVEQAFRAALSQMGSHTGCAEAPLSGAETKRWVVEHTVSQAWRIGRAVARARRMNRIDSVAETIIDACGGPAAARVIWKGKIVGVERTLRMGHVYGECIIEGADVAADGYEAASLDHGADQPAPFVGRVKIPFKNENIGVIRISKGADVATKECQQDVLALVPDLISVIDAQNGEAIGTPEYRYGLLVIVLGIAASDRWTGSERGIQIGGPDAFGFNYLKYDPLGTYIKPKSVIDEYDC
ncbi:hydantoinase [Grosmannia clavigera kw1407]|uniref:Hydantoinase n=1 Tax=Grosmannia clavigera (strain kw1407 / UAMH 11150) TaxID=655863 RepID=F0XB74_GROCL|nr:hydantoinase [Grosmannia clavigera kw1407]EFX05017.1 hydantoinase [Grosmannia clavigera kw1407]